MSLTPHLPTCPAWCSPDQDHTGPEGGRVHQRHLGGFWLREHRTGTGRVVRPGDDLMEVALELHEHEGGPMDPVVSLKRITEGREVRLTGGEARSLAAMLTAAADRLEGMRD